MRSPATPAHALRSLLVPALLLARGACSSSGCTSRLLRRPAFCFQDTPFCYAFGDAFRQLPQRLFARRGRRPVVPLSIPWLAVLGRGVPAGCARQRSCGSQVPARPLPRRLFSWRVHLAGVHGTRCRRCVVGSPFARRSDHCRSPSRASAEPAATRCAGRPTMAALLARKLGHAHAWRRGPTLSQRRAGDDTASVAWRERKAARRCLGTVARAFAQGSARDRAGSGGRRAVQEGCWRQRFHSTETRGEPHTPKLRHGRHRDGRCADERTLRASSARRDTRRRLALP
ncbi:hypothetical protein ERJ75_000900500 [Trypanosoma vivax]|nr:hypothetical protein ERJ75_000900500 [Trypanosoma vivax]